MNQTPAFRILTLALADALRGEEEVLADTYDRLTAAGQDDYAEALGTVEPDEDPTDVLAHLLAEELDEMLERTSDS